MAGRRRSSRRVSDAAAAAPRRSSRALTRLLLCGPTPQLTEAELAALGYVKASSVPQKGGVEFSGGLLPASAQADTYEDKSKARRGEFSHTSALQLAPRCRGVPSARLLASCRAAHCRC